MTACAKAENASLSECHGMDARRIAERLNTNASTVRHSRRTTPGEPADIIAGDNDNVLYNISIPRARAIIIYIHARIML